MSSRNAICEYWLLCRTLETKQYYGSTVLYPKMKNKHMLNQWSPFQSSEMYACNYFKWRNQMLSAWIYSHCGKCRSNREHLGFVCLCFNVINWQTHIASLYMSHLCLPIAFSDVLRTLWNRRVNGIHYCVPKRYINWPSRQYFRLDSMLSLLLHNRHT